VHFTLELARECVGNKGVYLKLQINKRVNSPRGKLEEALEVVLFGDGVVDPVPMRPPVAPLAVLPVLAILDVLPALDVPGD
jgi:hypothetical protein